MSVYFAYIFALSVSCFTTFLLARYAWSRRGTNGATMFAWTMSMTTGWAFFTLVSIFSPTESWARFWDNQFRYLFIAAFTVFFVGFILEYTGRGIWLKRLPWLFVPHIFLQCINWISPTSFIQYSGFEKHAGFYFVEETVFAWGFQLHSLYSYTLLALGIGLLIHASFQVASLYRRQIFIFLLGIALPITVNLVDILRIWDLPSLDWTVMTFSLTGLVWAWALFRYHLFDMMPVAYEAVFHSMEDAVLVLDSQNRINDLNPAAEKLIGLASGQLIGSDVRLAFPNQQALVQQFIPLSETQTELQVGNHVYDLKISTLQRQKGRLVVLHDISNRKRAEAEREQLIEELNAYAHSVAHDLKSPLSVVISSVDILDFDPSISAEKRQGHLERISRNSHKMVKIVDELLLLASVRGMDRIPIETLDMESIIEEAKQRLGQQLEGIELVLPSEWLPALGYAAWVEEIWFNYLSNAIKYGGKPPRVELGSMLDGDRVRFYIKDNGKGLTSEEQETLFRKFTRLDQNAAKGHGLGLSIVQRIARRLNGDVGVDSQVGIGSTFYFTLPKTP